MAKENFISDKLYPSIRNKNLFEINEVKFIGVSAFTPDELLQYVSVKPTSRSFPHKVIQSYYNEFTKNPSTPSTILGSLDNALKNLEYEIRFFEEASLEYDLRSLENYFNTRGFHYAEVSYSFKPDSLSKKNILSFNVKEKNRFTLSKLKYIGLDSLPSDVSPNIHNLMKIAPGSFFKESDIINEISSIHSVLLDKGYFYAYFEKPNVIMDTINLRDTVEINFSLGKRVKIGKITFVDSTAGQPYVVDGLKLRLMEVQTGDWYNRNALNRSVDNILSIGAFETVSIDTAKGGIEPDGVSMPFVIASNYRKAREWELGLFVNRTQISNGYNAGLEGSLFHRNMFGMAQAVNLFVSGSIKDLSLTKLAVEYEVQGGLKYAQPLLWSLGNTKIGLSWSLIYTLRTLYDFKIESFSFPIKFPVKLPKSTFFNSMSLDFSFERENPLNFISIKDNVYKNAKNSTDSTNMEGLLQLYQKLYGYLNDGETHLFTSNTMGISLISDTKNNPFTPSAGNYTVLSLDGWNVFLAHPIISGISRFFRFTLFHSQFWSVSDNVVGAVKGKIGAIYLMDDANSYVPLDKQFFSGGSNSVRGWESRKLRYSFLSKNTSKDTTNLQSSYSFLQNFVGNRGLIEGSAELRCKFGRPSGFNDFLRDQISKLGVTFFVDFGNAFHWLVKNDETKVTFADYITKVAIAGGLGVRYDTPVGPVRVDFAWPIVDPMKEYKPFSNLNVHLSIGHAF